jgi:hypothetical protein
VMLGPRNKNLFNGLSVCWVMHPSVTVLSLGGIHAQDLHGNCCINDFDFAGICR